MSAYRGEDAALEAMQEGAYDYVPKPFRADEVILTLRKAEERERLRRAVASLTAQLEATAGEQGGCWSLEQKRIDDYLAQSVDAADLEWRQRRLERRGLSL